MSASSTVRRHWRAVLAVLSCSAMLWITGPDVASAQSTSGEPEVVASGSAHIFGLPVVTAAWFFLGVLLLLGGLLASSRSRRQAAVVSFAGVGPAAARTPQWDPVGDVSSTVSAAGT